MRDYNTLTIGLPATVLIAISKLLLSGWVSAAFYSRLPFTIIGSFTAVGFYLFMVRVKQPEAGVVGAIFLAFEPSFIAMSRWAHRDVMLTFLFFLSIALFYLGETEDKFFLKVWSAVLFSLAFLAKISAIMIPIILLSWKALLYLRMKVKKSTIPDTSKEQKKARTNNTKTSQRTKNLSENLWLGFKVKEFYLPIISLSVIFLLWPALWTKPFFAITYFSRQLQRLGSSHLPMLLLGKSYVNPPYYYYYYYLVIMFIRLSPLILLSLVLGIILYFFNNKKTKNESDLWTLIFLWLVIFLIIVPFSGKMFEVRYILPIWPAVAFFVGYGLYKTFSYLLTCLPVGKYSVKKINKNLIVAFAAILIAIFELPVIFIYSPNYYMYYNAIVGGPSGAQKNKITLVGSGGEGTKSLALYVNKYFMNPNKKIVFFGYNRQFNYYLDNNIKMHTLYNTYIPYSNRIAEELPFKKVFTVNGKKVIYPFEDEDVIVLEDFLGELGVGLRKEDILSTGMFKVVYTSRVLGSDLGWVFVKK